MRTKKIDTRPIASVLFRVTEHGKIIAILPEFLGDLNQPMKCLAYERGDDAPKQIDPYVIVTMQCLVDPYVTISFRTKQAKPMQYKLFLGELKALLKNWKLEPRKLYTYAMYEARMKGFNAAKKAAEYGKV